MSQVWIQVCCDILCAGVVLIVTVAAIDLSGSPTPSMPGGKGKLVPNISQKKNLMLHEWLLGHMSEKNYQVMVTSPSEYGDALLQTPKRGFEQCVLS
jgi:hypothetical protein